MGLEEFGDEFALQDILLDQRFEGFAGQFLKCRVFECPVAERQAETLFFLGDDFRRNSLLALP